MQAAEGAVLPSEQIVRIPSALEDMLQGESEDADLHAAIDPAGLRSGPLAWATASPWARLGQSLKDP